MKLLKIQRNTLLNLKVVVSYLNFVFFIEVKAKSKNIILNFVFQFIKKNEMALWVHGFLHTHVHQGLALDPLVGLKATLRPPASFVFGFAKNQCAHIVFFLYYPSRE